MLNAGQIRSGTETVFLHFARLFGRIRLILTEKRKTGSFRPAKAKNPCFIKGSYSCVA